MRLYIDYLEKIGMRSNQKKLKVSSFSSFFFTSLHIIIPMKQSEKTERLHANINTIYFQHGFLERSNQKKLKGKTHYGLYVMKVFRYFEAIRKN